MLQNSEKNIEKIGGTVTPYNFQWSQHLPQHPIMMMMKRMTATIFNVFDYFDFVSHFADSHHI